MNGKQSVRICDAGCPCQDCTGNWPVYGTKRTRGRCPTFRGSTRDRRTMLNLEQEDEVEQETNPDHWYDDADRGDPDDCPYGWSDDDEFREWQEAHPPRKLVAKPQLTLWIAGLRVDGLMRNH